MGLLDACEHFDKALVSLLGMNDILREDLNALLDAFPDQSSQVLRRSFVQASWAYVEAITHALKLMASIMVDAATCRLEADEIAFLRAQRAGTLCNIKQTIHVVTKVFGLRERNLGGGSDWRLVKPSIKIRDRLVHPRAVESLQVGDTD
ncbi:hypothetical protein C206_08734 [Pseudomonas putida TRO1]|uniref:Uncharacterized protein n=2 Tax=Pseudomonas putida group TaxID=136845 RepID=A0AAP7FLC0_9PSED|nr:MULTISPECIES: hypothetical protein [Pseudomonas]HCI3895383.1 hypothetical protein [Pseudomonas aeruginosa]ELS0927292.1 hypothetical protein [Pseudomonas putida]ENY78056.1 hypothetical protein C206_08734 [Pseudomonas putida TRO1]OAH48019.1 hypothetical protein AYJ70_05835 [Pseudomonas monteilii]UWH25739.1 hypothetical protein KW568_09745 [Pseudomonas sp. HD6515]